MIIKVKREEGRTPGKCCGERVISAGDEQNSEAAGGTKWGPAKKARRQGRDIGHSTDPYQEGGNSPSTGVSDLPSLVFEPPGIIRGGRET